MGSAHLADYGRIVQLMVGAGTRAEVEKAVDELAAGEAWELAGDLLLSSGELGARVLVTKLLERKVYGPLAVAACMRRQIRPPMRRQRGSGTARRVFMDIDAETAAAGVPDYIQAEQDDLSALAAESREIAARREAERDADPIRAFIVTELAKAMLTSEAALEAMLAILRASAWEDTRRAAALKVINHPVALRRLAEACRTEDLLAVGTCCRLDSAARKVAEILAPRLDDLIASKATEALALIGRHHPDQVVREKALEGG